MMARIPDCAFWDFSLAAYARPGVAPACLALQERHGADVNLLLYACWLGASGRGALEAGRLAEAEALVGGWHRDVVRSLRGARQRLKANPDPAPPELALSLRRKLGALELEAEHLEQLALAGLAPPPPAKTAAPAALASAAVKGAMLYLRKLGAGLDGEDRASLRAVLAGCFPEASPAHIEAALGD
jgi:uncharacterized protein (TIGR02444 family)